MPQNHVLFKGKLQLQWSLWGIEDFFFSPLSLFFFPPAPTEKGKPLALRIFFYFYCGRKSSSFLDITALSLSSPLSFSAFLSNQCILIRGRLTMKLMRCKLQGSSFGHAVVCWFDSLARRMGGWRLIPVICRFPLCKYSCACAQRLSPVRLFAAPWIVACQAPLSMGLSR